MPSQIASLDIPNFEFSEIEGEEGEEGVDKTINITSIASDDAIEDLKVIINLEPNDTYVLKQSYRDENVSSIVVKPDFSELENDLELLFVVDRSGSMDTLGRVEKVRNALNACIEYLPENILFNIVGFGTNVECVFDESVVADEEHKKTADDYIKTIYGDMGKTEMTSAFLNILSKPLPKGRTRHVLLFTDGDFDEVNDALNAMDIFRSTTRFHMISFGLNGNWMKCGMEERNTGFLHLNSNVNGVVDPTLDIIKKILNPTITNVCIHIYTHPRLLYLQMVQNVLD